MVAGRQTRMTGTLVASEDAYGEITGWTYTTSSDQIETYDAEGRILSTTDRSGLSHTYTYQSDSITVTHTSGDTLVYHLNGTGRVIGFTDPDNKSYQYRYDTEDRIVSVTYPDDTPLDSTDNPKRIYHYEDNNFPRALTGITDENGNRYATWDYDEEGRAISSEHANGVDKVTLTYNTENGTTTATNPLGKQTTYHFTTIHGVRKVTQVEGHPTASCEGANKSYSYDANGNIASKTDWNGVTTTYTYDMNRNLELSRTEAVGTPQERTITTEWHSQFRLPSKITEPNRITEYTYDAQGRQLSSKVIRNQ
jgi:YD repeat-containing protein